MGRSPLSPHNAMEGHSGFSADGMRCNTQEVVTLIGDCLVRDPTMRPTAAQAYHRLVELALPNACSSTSTASVPSSASESGLAFSHSTLPGVPQRRQT